MKPKIKVKIFLAILCISVMVPSFLRADAVSYFYDDTGRLARVLKGTEGMVYQYDEVGNLLSIDKGTVAPLPPVIDSIIPDLFFIGETIPVAIAGHNLFTTNEVKSNSSSLTIKVLNVTDTDIKAEVTVSPDALPGTVINITVTTSYGSATIQATLSSSKLTFSPGQLVLAPGSGGDIAVSLIPSVGRNLTITLTNSSPSIVSIPRFITIPSSGTTTFAVNGIKEGVATISSGNPRTVVFVTRPFRPEPGEEVINKAGPVSVYIEEPQGMSSIASLPVSIYVESPTDNTATTSSLPVSVDIESPTSESSTIGSLPVSVLIEAQEGNADVISLPVSIIISP